MHWRPFARKLARKTSPPRRPPNSCSTRARKDCLTICGKPFLAEFARSARKVPGNQDLGRIPRLCREERPSRGYDHIMPEDVPRRVLQSSQHGTADSSRSSVMNEDLFLCGDLPAAIDFSSRQLTVEEV